jgi:hypothetical protein
MCKTRIFAGYLLLGMKAVSLLFICVLLLLWCQFGVSLKSSVPQKEVRSIHDEKERKLAPAIALIGE